VLNPNLPFPGHNPQKILLAGSSGLLPGYTGRYLPGAYRWEPNAVPSIYRALYSQVHHARYGLKRKNQSFPDLLDGAYASEM